MNADRLDNSPDSSPDDSSRKSMEATEADSAEQRAELTPQGDDPVHGGDPARSAEGDRAEQARTVTLDEDEYR